MGWACPISAHTPPFPKGPLTSLTFPTPKPWAKLICCAAVLERCGNTGSPVHGGAQWVPAMHCGEASKVDLWNLKLWSFPVLCCLFRCWNRIQTYIFDLHLHLGIYRILRILRMRQVLNSGRNAWLRRNTEKHKLQILESNWNTERSPVLRCPEPKSESPKGASNPQVHSRSDWSNEVNKK